MKADFEICEIDCDLIEKSYVHRFKNLKVDDDIESYIDYVDQVDNSVYDYSESTGVVIIPDSYAGDDRYDEFDEILRLELTDTCLGRCVDFGAGIRRRHCEYQTCVEHVESQLTASKCPCGANIVTYMTYDAASRVETFMAINSLQNNPERYQRNLLNLIKQKNWNFLISVPNTLGFCEYDSGDIIMQLFPEVRIKQYPMCRFYRYFKETIDFVHKREVLVSSVGDPVYTSIPGYGVFVSGLPIDLDEFEFGQVFENFGPVSKVSIVKDKDSDVSKGFGFVTMSIYEGADSAIKALNGSEVFGRKIKVDRDRDRQFDVDGRRNGSYRYVACVVANGNSIFAVRTDQGPLDFVAAGHIRYGEKPLVAMRREWSEEVMTPIPDFKLLGRVDSLNNRDITFVYFAEVGSVKCVPSRGSVVPINLNSVLRYSFNVALKIIAPMRPWNFNCDIVTRNYYNYNNRKLKSKKKGIVELNETIKNKIGEIKVYRNSTWHRVSVLSRIQQGSRITIDKNSSLKAVDTLLVLYMSQPLGFAKLVQVLDTKLVYRVFELIVPYQRVVQRYFMYDVNSRPNPIKSICQLYNVGIVMAEKIMKANKGIVPVFNYEDGHLDLESNGNFI